MNSNSNCVFVVEDSKDLRDLIQLMYEGEGYSVEFGCDGQDALDKLRAMDEPPGVILLDLMMPVMDGYQFRAEQEKDPKLSLIPVLVMTADANAQEKAEKLKVNGYIRKPVDVDTLIKVAEKYCT